MDIVSLLSVLIAILSIVVVGAIGFWAIERFVTDGRSEERRVGKEC